MNLRGRLGEARGLDGDPEQDLGADYTPRDGSALTIMIAASFPAAGELTLTKEVLLKYMHVHTVVPSFGPVSVCALRGRLVFAACGCRVPAPAAGAPGANSHRGGRVRLPPTSCFLKADEPTPADPHGARASAVFLEFVKKRLRNAMADAEFGNCQRQRWQLLPLG